MHIALLRAINVGGRNLVAMADLKEMLGALGFAGATSLLQSGNLVFRSERKTGALLERVLEAETQKRLGVSVDYVVRTAGEWAAVVGQNPFPDEAKRDPARLVVVFLKTEPAAESVKELEAAIKGPEVVRLQGKHLYAVYPLGQGTSKLTNTLIEKKLGARGTARNWNTVLKLAAMAEE
jgi:uncharacterized protein (DUF1697 family)